MSSHREISLSRFVIIYIFFFFLFAFLINTRVLSSSGIHEDGRRSGCAEICEANSESRMSRFCCLTTIIPEG